MISYRFLSPSQEEMAQAAVFYDTASPGLGTDFLDDVQLAIDKVRAYPEAGVALTQNLRRILLHRFPFSIIYAVEDALIVVVAVAHHARRPGYWQSRTDR